MTPAHQSPDDATTGRGGDPWTGSLPTPGQWIDIHYSRPGKELAVFRQRVLEAAVTHVVTFQPATELSRPVSIDGKEILVPGSPVIWFTMPGAWHDIGIFHLPNDRRTGTYANILTPVRFEHPDKWHTTDLFLDWWVPEDGNARLLDEDELRSAEARALVTAREAHDAKREAQRLEAEWLRGTWPPSFVAGWTLERARKLAAQL